MAKTMEAAARRRASALALPITPRSYYLTWGVGHVRAVVKGAWQVGTVWPSMALSLEDEGHVLTGHSLGDTCTAAAHTRR